MEEMEALAELVEGKVESSVRKVAAPQGWTYAAIGDLCTLINGRAFKPSDWTNTGLPIIRIQNLNNPDAKFNHFSGNVEPKFLVDNGELLFAWSGTPGTSFGAHIWTGGRAVLNQHIFRVLFDETVIDKTLFKIAINQKLQELIDKAHGGVGLRHVTKGKFEQTEILLPPLNEQRRIVAKIEALKARSQRVKEELEAIAPLLDQFRQSVLAAAFRGDLTADWREKNPDVEPASVLLERIRAERRRRWEQAELEKMRSKGKEPLTEIWKAKYEAPEVVDSTDFLKLPRGWCWARVQDLSLVQLGRQRSPQNHAGEYMRKYLRAANITWSGLDLSDVKEMNFNPEDFKRFRLEYGDILLNEASGSQSEVGKPAIWRDEISDCCIQNTLIRVRPAIPISEFLYYHFFWNARSGAFGNASKGIGIHHLGSQLLAEWLIRVPPIEEQKEIVFRIRKLLKAADSIQQQYQESKVYLDQLNQSILAKAFRGELVPQDPNDEPASVLLERIRAEREKLDTKKKAKGKTEKKSRKAKPEPAEPEQLSLPGFE